MEIFKKKLPKIGSTYIHLKKDAYYGMSGVVGHHDCGTRFYIFDGKRTLANIKP